MNEPIGVVPGTPPTFVTGCFLWMVTDSAIYLSKRSGADSRLSSIACFVNGNFAIFIMGREARSVDQCSE